MERSQAASAELGPPPAVRLHDALEQSRSNLGDQRTDALGSLPSPVHPLPSPVPPVQTLGRRSETGATMNGRLQGRAKSVNVWM